MTTKRPSRVYCYRCGTLVGNTGTVMLGYNYFQIHLDGFGTYGMCKECFDRLCKVLEPLEDENIRRTRKRAAAAAT